VRDSSSFDLEEVSHGKAGHMPRRPPRPTAVQTAQNFSQFLIVKSDTEDCILPKNGASACFVGSSLSQKGCMTDGEGQIRTGALLTHVELFQFSPSTPQPRLRSHPSHPHQLARKRNIFVDNLFQQE